MSRWRWNISAGPRTLPRLHQEWIDGFQKWIESLGISARNLEQYEQSKEELAHYAERTVDIIYRYFPEREDEEKQWDELMGIANRTDYDLRVHSKKPEDAEGKRINPDSTEDLSYFDPQTNERFYPYVIEPAIGVNRTLLAVMMDAYTEKTNEKGETRVILKLTPEMAPIKVAVLPLAKNKPEIVEMAKKLKHDLQPSMRAVYDDTGGIGKLYARQDEIGTPFCVTVDHRIARRQRRHRPRPRHMGAGTHQHRRLKGISYKPPLKRRAATLADRWRLKAVS